MVIFALSGWQKKMVPFKNLVGFQGLFDTSVFTHRTRVHGCGEVMCDRENNAGISEITAKNTRAE